MQPEQEKKQLERVAAEVAGTIFEEEILHIFEGIIENSKRIQAKTLFDKKYPAHRLHGCRQKALFPPS